MVAQYLRPKLRLPCMAAVAIHIVQEEEGRNENAIQKD
jgi:hypothetical protein